MFKTMRLRLIGLCSATTIFVLCVITFAALRIAERQVELQAAQAFTSNLNAISYYLGNRAVIDTTWLAQTEASEGLLIRVDVNGTAIAYTYHNPRREKLTQLAREIAQSEHDRNEISFTAGSLQTEIVQYFVEEDGARYRAAVCRIPIDSREIVEVTVLKSTDRESRQVWGLRLAFGGWVLIGAACLSLFAWFFTRRLVRPVEEARRRQTDFVSAASHELRSPLTVIKTSLGVLPGASGEELDKLTHVMETECNRLSLLAKDLLSLAGADAQGWTVGFRPAQPESIILTVQEHFTLQSEERQINLTFTLPVKPLRRCVCDPKRIEQLLIILVDNALRFTPAGGSIVLGVEGRGRKTAFSVLDTGPGIPDAEKPFIFDRFYKSDQSRSDREHYGLGLSIAKEIASIHRGDLSVSDNLAGGAVFTLVI